MKGSENGAVVKPGNAADSDFVKLVVEGKMPKRATRLPANEMKILTDSVNAAHRTTDPSVTSQDGHSSGVAVFLFPDA